MFKPVAAQGGRVHRFKLAGVASQLRLAAVFQLDVALEEGRLRGDIVALGTREAAVQVLGQLKQQSSLRADILEFNVA